ncbi:hypothetical protein DESC_920009 [Desulfosarcina cetonica]|nr:hypothetical protein DESC_920009 [Desulfosarcina cetonica]
MTPSNEYHLQRGETSVSNKGYRSRVNQLSYSHLEIKSRITNTSEYSPMLYPTRLRPAIKKRFCFQF